MNLVTENTKLSDIVLHDPTVVTVFNRFGIRLGVGDHTVDSICQLRGLDTEFFLVILNTYLFHEYFPERILSSFDARLITAYLSKTNAYYEQFQIPNIERHFTLLLQRTEKGNSNLQLMMDFFMEVKRQLKARIADDRNRWFPEIAAQSSPAPEATIGNRDEESDSIEDKIDDLLNMFIIHLRGDYDSNLCQAVIMALFSLKKDIAQNNRIRNRILKPLSAAMGSNSK